MGRYIATIVMKVAVAVILATIGLYCCACGRGPEESVTAGPASDPIVGLWSAETLFKGSLWVGYAPDGQVAYILDPSKAPGTLGSLSAVNAVYQSTGRWSRDGSVYKVVMFRGGREVGTKFYKLDGARLSECGQDGLPKAEGEEWSQKMPGDPATLTFIDSYIKTPRGGN
jgi:hypothetical protein